MSLTYVHEYLLTAATEDVRKSIIAKLKDQLLRQDLSLLELVSSLGDYLTDTNVTIRSRSTQILADVLRSLPLDILSAQQIQVMASFFADRLHDEVCLESSLSALSAIANMDLFGSEETRTIAVTVIGRAKDVQNYPQRVRYQIFTLFNKLMNRHRQILRSLGRSFVIAFSDIMTGEKDPRNLMIALSLMAIILKEFDIVADVSELFDVVYCYFPITFRPPPDDPVEISTEDLKTELRRCLCATHLFAPYLLPALLEKLNAVALSVKKDTMMTLIECSHLYHPESFETFSIQLWDAIKFEIIQAEDSILEVIALEVLTAITKCFARGLREMPKQGLLSQWLQPIVFESVEQLKEPELKSARPCGKILRSIASASAICCQVVVKSILPGLIALCLEALESSRKTSLLGVLNQILEAVSLLEGHLTSASRSAETSCIQGLEHDLLAILSQALIGTKSDEVEMKMMALSCLRLLALNQCALTDLDRNTLASYWSEIVIEESGAVHDKALAILVEMSTVRPNIILEQSFPRLLVKLSVDGSAYDSVRTKSILSALACLATDPMTFNIFLIRLTSRLDACLTRDPSDLSYPLDLMNALYQVVRALSATQKALLARSYHKIVPMVLTRTIIIPVNVMSSTAILCISAQIINLVVQDCDREMQRQCHQDFVGLFISGVSNSLIRHPPSSFRPFQDMSEDTPDLHEVETLFLAAMAAMRRDIEPITDWQFIFIQSVVLANNTYTNESNRLIRARIIAILINKCVMATELEALIECCYSPSMRLEEYNIQLILWLAKALILRAHPSSLALLEILLAGLNTPLGRDIAMGFQILIGDDQYMTKENHAVIKPLHKQKFYNISVQRLLTQMANAPQGQYTIKTELSNECRIPQQLSACRAQDRLPCP